MQISAPFVVDIFIWLFFDDVVLISIVKMIRILLAAEQRISETVNFQQLVDPNS